MDYKDSIEQIREHISVLNREGGEIRDCIAGFKAENAEFHGKMASDIDWIRTQLRVVIMLMVGLIGTAFANFFFSK